MKKTVLLAFSILTACLCFAQDELPTVVPDRPGYTWGAEVTPYHKVIWDHGFGYESTPEGASTLTLSSSVLRYGLFENLELRVGTDFMMYNDGDAEKPTFGFSPLTVGTKIKVYDGYGVLPSIGLLAELASPHVGSKDLLPSHLAPSMYLLFEHTVTDWLGICYNVGEQWDGESATPTTFLAFCLNFCFNDYVGAFVETYNYIHPEGENQYMTELGFTWLVSRRVQLDIEGDFDLQNFGKYYAVGCGVSWMIN
ncbi:MAG: transporter [Bacteroidales bacterium]|nr:transporter [Bacteroidales bacterium]